MMTQGILRFDYFPLIALITSANPLNVATTKIRIKQAIPKICQPDRDK
jgi:hypothetical protein